VVIDVEVFGRDDLGCSVFDPFFLIWSSSEVSGMFGAMYSVFRACIESGRSRNVRMQQGSDLRVDRMSV